MDKKFNKLYYSHQPPLAQWLSFRNTDWEVTGSNPSRGIAGFFGLKPTPTQGGRAMGLMGRLLPHNRVSSTNGCDSEGVAHRSLKNGNF